MRAAERPHARLSLLSSPVGPFYPFLEEGAPTKIDYQKKGTLILTSLLEHLVWVSLSEILYFELWEKTLLGVVNKFGLREVRHAMQ